MEEAAIVLLALGQFDVEGEEVKHFQDLLDANEYLASLGERKAILVVDFFSFMESIDEINTLYRSDENVVRVLLFPDEMDKEVQEFQQSSMAFDLIAPLPFSKEFIVESVGDFLSSFSQEAPADVPEVEDGADSDDATIVFSSDQVETELDDGELGGPEVLEMDEAEAQQDEIEEIKNEEDIEEKIPEEDLMSNQSDNDNEKHEISLSFSIDDLSDSPDEAELSDASGEQESVDEDDSQTQKTIVFSSDDLAKEAPPPVLDDSPTESNASVDLESELEGELDGDSFSLDDSAEDVSFSVEEESDVPAVDVSFDSGEDLAPSFDSIPENTGSLEVDSLGDDDIAISDPVDEPAESVSLFEDDDSVDLDSVSFDESSDDLLGEEQVEVSAVDVADDVSISDTVSDVPLAAEVSYDEVTRVQGTLRAMRVERNKLLAEVEELRKNLELSERDNLTLSSENEELKIELSIVKKRYKDDVDQIKGELKMSQEKRDLVEARLGELKQEKVKIGDRVRVDMAQVRRREKELENKLELISIDSQNQIQNRDKIILDLKRKIDALEFSIESSTINQQRAFDQKSKNEQRVGQAIKALKSTLLALESEDDDALVDETTKNL